MQLVITIVLTTLLMLLGFDWLTIGIYIVLPVTILQAFMSILVVRYSLGPVDILSRSIAHVSKETNSVTPPNINGTYFERTGIKAMVETVYNLALEGDAPKAAPAEMERTIMDQLPVGLIALDENRAIVYASANAPIHTDAGGNQTISLVFQGHDTLRSWLEQSEKNSVSGEHSWTRIQTALPDEQNRRICDVVALYQKKGKGGVETVIATIDRTAHYAADEEDMDFIALAAHELRGPITVIRGYLDVLSDELGGSLQADQEELFKRLSVSASRLSGYVSNILNVSRYDRRHLQLHLREDRLSDVYALIADDLALRASTLNRLLSVDIPDTLPTVAADRSSLTEVLANLVDNAIKYSSEGGIVKVTAQQEGGFVSVQIVDHGIGIPGSVVGHLFSKFYRSHRSRQTVAGTGLGLYISKAIIESHGGQIGVSSTEGQGSTFHFSVPVYSTVADRLLANNNGNLEVIESANGWIKNHSMFRG